MKSLRVSNTTESREAKACSTDTTSRLWPVGTQSGSMILDISDEEEDNDNHL